MRRDKTGFTKCGYIGQSQTKTMKSTGEMNGKVVKGNRINI